MSSASTTLALSNLDFEFELAHGVKGSNRSVTSRITERWSSILRLLPEARQAQCLDHRVRYQTSPRRSSWGHIERLIAWGASESVVQLADKLSISQAMPNLEAVCQANDKRYSHALEKQLGIALAYSCLITSVEQLEQVVKECPYDWVLKHPFGFSALERMVGRQGDVSESALGWARRRIRDGWSLLFEPWVENTTNLSIHFEIDCLGKIRYLGHCRLHTDTGGVHRGNSVTPEGIDPIFEEKGHEICSHLASLGYWGYVGIDALTGELEGDPVIRPLVEINARCSFGRLTLALGEWIPQGWSYLWWHPRQSDPTRTQAYPPLPPLGENRPLSAGVYSLPELVDPQQSSGTRVLMAATVDELSGLEREFHGHFLE